MISGYDGYKSENGCLLTLPCFQCPYEQECERDCNRRWAFLICPVRGHSPEETAALVARLEGEGWYVHWPPRDTNQDDATGLRICQDNRAAIEQAERIFVVWDGQSQGCLFDLGMAFAMRKPITCLSLPATTDGKSFQNMMRAWESQT